MPEYTCWAMPETESASPETLSHEQSGEDSGAMTPSNGSSVGNTGYHRRKRKRNANRKKNPTTNEGESSGKLGSPGQEETLGRGGVTTSSPESEEQPRGRTRVRGTRRVRNMRKQHRQQKHSMETTGSSAQGEMSAKGTIAHGTTAGETTTDKATSGNETSEHADQETTDADTQDEIASKVEPKAKKQTFRKSKWTVSEEALLRKMKKGDETWADICSALNKSKREVKARWKTIKDRPAPSETETTDVATTTEEFSSASSPDKKRRGRHRGKNKNEKSKPRSPASKKRKDGRSESPEKDTGKAISNPVSNRWHSGAHNAKVATENQWAKARATTPADILSGEEAGSDDSSTWGVFGYGDRAQRHYRRYVHDQIYKPLYPPMIHPKPDDIFKEKECEILATLDSKYKRTKWLEMQANFFNVTGRMVSAEAIKSRVLKAEAAEERKQREHEQKRANKANGKEEKEAKTGKEGNRQLEKRLKKVETWMKKMEEESDSDGDS